MQKVMTCTVAIFTRPTYLSHTCILNDYYTNSKHGDVRKYTKLWLESLKEKDKSQVLDVDGRFMIK
jgi:hypothetical protein